MVLLGLCSRNKAATDASHLGTPPESYAGHIAGQIGCLGRYLAALINLGGLWAGCRHRQYDSISQRRGLAQKDRDKGVVPHTSIDTEAHWTKSGWHGWCYGWKLQLVATAAAVWIPLAADLTPANVADNEAAPALLRELPFEARFILGDRLQALNVQEICDSAGRILVKTQYGYDPHTGDGVEERRVLHKLRSVAIENQRAVQWAVRKANRSSCKLPT